MTINPTVAKIKQFKCSLQRRKNKQTRPTFKNQTTSCNHSRQR